jgi:A/G-specific adenine glycosylase
MISEFMLQQTQASRVIPKYEMFIKNFPTMEALSKSENKKLFSIWLGLGYNRRAIWLKDAVSQILKNGEFPKKPNDLIKFKGIGLYTSNSISIFAFNSDTVAVDVNIKRVLLNFGFITLETPEKEIYKIMTKLLPKGKSRDWHNALMDFGHAELRHIKLSSKSYEKFKGSKRETRGKIVKMLTENGPLSQEFIINEFSQNDIDLIIEELIADGLIHKNFQKLSV